MAKELEHLPATLPDNLHVFPLGQAETAQSIAIKRKNKRTLAKRKGSSAQSGCSQQRTLGHDAVSRVIDERFAQFISRILIPAAYRLGGGLLTSINIRVFCSANGGMGGGAANTVAKQLTRVLLSSTSAVVQTSYFLTGAQSYLNCGPGIIPNAGACLHEIVDSITDPLRHPKEVRTATLFELPQTTTEHRAEWIALVHQTVKSQEYSRILDPLLSNVTADEDPYHVQLLRVAAYQSLDALKDIAPTISAEYVETLQSLKSLAEQRLSLLLSGLRILIDKKFIARPDLKSLMRSLSHDDIEPDDFIKLVESPDVIYDVTINGVTDDNGLLNLTKSQETFALPPTTTTQIAVRQHQFVAALGLLAKECKGLEVELAGLLKEQAQLQTRLRAKLRLLHPDTTLRHARSLLANAAALLADIAQLIVKLRSVFDQVWLSMAELKAVKAATEAVRSEQSQLNAKLSLMQSVLSELCYRDALEHARTYVTAKPLDDVLGALWLCDAKTSSAVIRQFILYSVNTVTNDGLSKCLGCRDSRVESIGQALIDRNHYAEIAPPWGGEPRQKPGMLLHALPPINATLFEKLKTYVLQRTRDQHLFMVDSLSGGVTVLDLQLTNVNSREEIFTPFYTHALEQAKAAKAADLYFPHGRPE